MSAAAGREEVFRRYGRTNSGMAEAETDRQREARHRREDATLDKTRRQALGVADEGRAEAARRAEARATANAHTDPASEPFGRRPRTTSGMFALKAASETGSFSSVLPTVHPVADNSDGCGGRLDEPRRPSLFT